MPTSNVMIEKRPLGVTLLGSLVVLAGVALLVLSIANLLGYYGAYALELAPDISREFFLISSGWNLVVGIALLASGNGLLGLRPWAWWLTFLVALLAVLRALFAFLSGVAEAAFSTLLSSFAGLALGLVILGYIFSVRQHFRAARPPPRPIPEGPPP